jgi:transcriptional regulator with XRE-family HTH domain
MFPCVPTQDEPDQDLAEAIRQLRARRGMTQEEVAYEAGLTISSYREIEKGRTNPAWTTLQRIASALGVSMGELVDATERAAG